jgi:hypothetical protein
MPAPTYWTEVHADGQPVYHCMICQEQGSEHHSSDEALFLAHMEQRHDGRMQEGTAADAKKPEETPGGRPDTPPGQEGEQPGNRPDVPPGQVEEPHVEHHEEGT